MLMKLYEINDELMSILNEHNDAVAAGEDTKAIEARWNEMCIDRTLKIEGSCCYVKNKLAEAAVIDAIAKVHIEEAKKLSDRANAIKNEAEGTRKYIQSQLQDKEKFKSPRAQISWGASRTTAKIRPGFEHLVPDDFIEIEYKHKTNLDKVKEFLEKPETNVEWAYLNKSVFINIK